LVQMKMYDQHLMIVLINLVYQNLVVLILMLFYVQDVHMVQIFDHHVRH
jgi:hypothetical protein